MSGFSTINTAVTGLAAAQRALDATSQNIVNANTPGYSRQRVLLESTGASVTASFHTGNGAVFGGVKVADVTRIRDAFLEATRAAAGGRQAAISAQTDILSGAQLLLSEPGETGLQSTLDSFYSAWQGLSVNPSDPSAGSVVIQRGSAVTDQLHAVANGVSAQWSTALQNLGNTVAETNQAASDLAKLNSSINAGQVSGKTVNELLDTRDLLIRKLGSLVGAYASTDNRGQVSVSINGVGIVSGEQWSAVALTGAQDVSNAVVDPPGLSVGGYTVSVESGQAAGLLATMRSDLPSMSSRVNEVATALIAAVNGVFSTGYDASGNTGADFFTGTDAYTIGVVPTTADQLQVAAVAGKVDGTVARQLGDLTNDAKVAAQLGGPGPSVRWRELTTALGVQVQSLETARTVQDAVVAASEDAVQSDAGVNMDEEMTNLMLFQRSYQASARVVTTADELMDTLINRTGMVGR